MTDDTIYVLQCTPGTGPPASELREQVEFRRFCIGLRNALILSLPVWAVVGYAVWRVIT